MWGKVASSSHSHGVDFNPRPLKWQSGTVITKSSTTTLSVCLSVSVCVFLSLSVYLSVSVLCVCLSLSLCLSLSCVFVCLSVSLWFSCASGAILLKWRQINLCSCYNDSHNSGHQLLLMKNCMVTWAIELSWCYISSLHPITLHGLTRSSRWPPTPISVDPTSISCSPTTSWGTSRHGIESTRVKIRERTSACCRSASGSRNWWAPTRRTFRSTSNASWRRRTSQGWWIGTRWRDSQRSCWSGSKSISARFSSLRVSAGFGESVNELEKKRN